VYVVRTDGTEVTRLGYQDQRDLAYSWSSDGERIALFIGEGAESDQGQTSAGIYTMAADGTDVRRLTDGGGHWIDAFPSFSPDGSKIVFQSDRTGTAEIYVMDADGSNEVLLSDFDDDPRDDYTPTWSPDGERIAFVRGEIPPGGLGELWVMDADGSNAHVLLDTPPVDFPSWSPDGSRIAFELGNWPDVRVGVVDLDAGIVTDLGTGYHPVWSPDATRLAISDPDGGFAIVQVDASSRRQVVSTTAWWAGAWSPDGEWIVYNGAGLTDSSG
jgi:TolB protein